MSARKSIRQYRHTLSEREANILSSLSYRDRTIFTADDLKEFTPNPKNLLDGLSRKKWILKIRKGVYAIVPFEAGELGSISSVTRLSAYHFSRSAGDHAITVK
jgi:predicted transcriptional regulator of viral defense system